MLIELSPGWIIILNIILLFLLHISTAYLITSLPGKAFDPLSWLYRERKWEKDGRVYESLFKIKAWKGMLPDGAALFSRGFAKKHLLSFDTEYLHSFITETCRGELAHWLVIVLSPLFFIFNWWWGGIIIVVYSLFASLPCIMTQRYNRIRFIKMLAKKASAPGVPVK